MAVVVNPEVFDRAAFNAAEIVRIVEASADAALPGVLSAGDVLVHIDENAPTTRCQVVSLDPITFRVEAGALEQYSSPQNLGESEAATTFARLFLEVDDLRSDTFNGPALGSSLSHAHRIAWDINLFGRCSRLGFEANRPRRRYDFRNRHGFSRPAERSFEQLWAAENLSWLQIVELSDTAVAPMVASRPRLSGPG